eukprot:2730766-Pleurochrysis_carterae.AAC.1
MNCAFTTGVQIRKHGLLHVAAEYHGKTYFTRGGTLDSEIASHKSLINLPANSRCAPFKCKLSRNELIKDHCLYWHGSHVPVCPTALKAAHIIALDGIKFTIS